MNPFLNLTGRFKNKPAPLKVRLVQTNSLNLSMETWRQNEQLVAELSAIAKLPVFEAMLQTLRNESPLNYMGVNNGPDEKIKHLGHIEGYQMALNNIEALAKLAKQPEPLVATFEPSDKPE